MKTLKFESHLADMILAGAKRSTWRMFDDKDLQTGDIVELWRRSPLEPIGQAELTLVYEKAIKEIAKEDYDGHETYLAKRR